jgi:hypothetical protein
MFRRRSIIAVLLLLVCVRAASAGVSTRQIQFMHGKTVIQGVIA